ncbi:MAG: hypothetical protein QM742_10005 [Aquabacterium sp.]
MFWNVLQTDGETVINRVYGEFTKGTPASLEQTPPRLFAMNAASSVVFNNVRLDAQWARVFYRDAANPLAALQSATLAKTATGEFTWDALNLLLNTEKEYVFNTEVFDGNGRLVSGTEGRLHILPQQGVTVAQVKQAEPGSKWTFIPPNTQANKLKLYVQLKGSTETPLVFGPQEADADGCFRFNALTAAPAQSDLTYEYHYEMFKSDGLPIKHLLTGQIVEVHGEITLTDRKPDTGLRHLLTGFADATKSIIRSQSYNAFGEIIEQIDARGNHTTLSYNKQGKLILKKDAETTIVASDGSSTNARPTTQYFYDLQGRLIGTRDANNFANGDIHAHTQAWTAMNADGSSKLAAEHFYGAGTKIYEYDVFGDLVSVINQNWDGVAANKARYQTKYLYDKKHKLVELQHAQRLDGSRGSDKYRYDSVGNRISKTSIAVPSSEESIVTTDFDAIGRITKTVDGAQRAISFTYEDGVWINGASGNLVKGTRKTTDNANDSFDKLIDEFDAFDRVTKHTDLSGHVTTYRYNGAGLLIEQKSDRGQHIQYDYYADSRVRRMVDLKYRTYTHYNYDDEGNKTYEAYATRFNSNIYQEATIEYDELNRIKRITDPAYSLEYQYDAVGNRRHLVGTVAGIATQNYWYTYDTVHRLKSPWGPCRGT